MPTVSTREDQAPPQATPAPLGLARSRARVYRTLSLAYARPADGPLLEQLASWSQAPRQFPEEDLPAMMRRGLRKIRAWSDSHRAQPSPDRLTVLGAEFPRLFRGLNRAQSPLPPYESVYREAAGLVFGESTAEVRQEYRRFGLDVTEGLKGEPPDHISFELEFMRLLCSQEAAARERHDQQEAARLLEAERHFLKKHLTRWVPQFCENISKFDTSGFYTGLAQVTRGWLTCDLRVIKGLMELGSEAHLS